MSVLAQGLVFLAATVVAVPISRRLGLGSILGYLAAGVVIGPFGLALIPDVENLLHFAELGVVLFLFVIGLELQPERLWQLRRPVFGMGGAQVAITGGLLALLGLAFGLSPSAAFVAGVGLSLSSTAFALQLLAEKNELTREYGQASFAVLLFQDLAVIPMLAILPMLGESDAAASGPIWLSTLKAVVAIGVVLVGGRYVLRPVFRRLAAVRSQEVFTAAALLVAVGTALIVNAAGLSAALGAFLAGVLLAGSEYKHELEADIEPFKGLLLGIFFIAVGMSIQLGFLVRQPLLVLGLVLGLVALKALVLFAIGSWKFRAAEPALSMAIAVSQGGEFAFVLFNLAVGRQIMDRATADMLVVVVGLSMAVTPLLFALYERWVRPALRRLPQRAFDVAPEEDARVIIAGFGRVGQVVARVLRAKRIPFTAMDINPEHIAFVQKFGNKVFFGDASRLDLLRAARADKARILVVAIDDVPASIQMVEVVRQNFPKLTVFARAR
ncbi:MAG TPA: monovalent cation:proton antiporter-2 (CPA2) family protein, partial [Myxococcaceae bacterium]|nr:monovalent cation:proton antiporter-2 (CPA2) family protein [Myxococcaceae bacterium]